MQSELVLTDKELPTAVIRAIKEGRKIEAIKILREATGLGLANAKVVVDRVSRTHGPKKKILSFKDESAGGGRWLALLIAAMLLAIAWSFYRDI